MITVLWGLYHIFIGRREVMKVLPRKRPEVPEAPKSVNIPTTVRKKCPYLLACGMCELKKVMCEKYGLPADQTYNH